MVILRWRSRCVCAAGDTTGPNRWEDAPVEWPLLDGVPDQDRQRFLGIARARKYGRGEVVFLAGAPADSLHLVVSGKFAVRVGTETGDMAMLSVLGAGDFFGELALLDPESGRTATVTALEASQTLSVGRSEFKRLKEEHPPVDRVLVSVLSAQVRRLSTQLVEAMYLPAEARVYRRLLAAAEMWGGAVPGTVIPLTQEDIAELAGTTRPTANRVLRQAASSGLLRIKRGRIELLDPRAIAALAAGAI
jgi:CRP/FNR family cyclic AMP-dependent transcriptional regulator